MDFAETFGRVVAAVATGGASEVVIHVLEESQAAAKDVTASLVGGTMVGFPGVPGQAISYVNRTNCCNFEFDGKFLLDTVNGKVWRYDEISKTLVVVKRQRTATESGLLASVLGSLKVKMATEYKGMTPQDMIQNKELYEAYDKMMAGEIKVLVTQINTPIHR